MSPRHTWCLVPNCKSTNILLPEKLFIEVPKDNIKMKNTWLQLAGRDPELLSNKSVLYLCEDHFDLENDMENYTEYKIGSVKQIRMKPNCRPSRFDCQTDRKRVLAPCETPPDFSKMQRLSLSQEAGHTLVDKESAGIPSSATSMNPGPSERIKEQSYVETTIKKEVEDAVRSIVEIDIDVRHRKQEPGLVQLVSSEPAMLVKEEILEDSDQDADEQRGEPAADSIGQGELLHIKEQLEDTDLDIGPTVLQDMDSHYRTTKLDEDWTLAADTSSTHSPRPRSSVSSDETTIKKPTSDRKRKAMIEDIVRAVKDDKEFDGVGINVACKLRRMDEEQRIHAELLINKVLIHGINRRLRGDTDLTGLIDAQPQLI